MRTSVRLLSSGGGEKERHMNDDELYIDDTMSYADIDALGLTVRQLELAYDGGMLSHLDETEIKGLGLAALKRDAASLSGTRQLD
jgi:hypothetical protein